MKLSIEKCQTFEVVAKKDTWFIKEPGLKIGKQTIPNVDPMRLSNIWRQNRAMERRPLWCNCSRTSERGEKGEETLPQARPEAGTAKSNISSLAIFIILLVSPPSDTVLKLLDSEVRQEVKIILHLMPSTATGFFYTPKALWRLRHTEI